MIVKDSIFVYLLAFIVLTFITSTPVQLLVTFDAAVVGTKENNRKNRKIERSVIPAHQWNWMRKRKRDTTTTPLWQRRTNWETLNDIFRMSIPHHPAFTSMQIYKDRIKRGSHFNSISICFFFFFCLSLLYFKELWLGVREWVCLFSNIVVI